MSSADNFFRNRSENTVPVTINKISKAYGCATLAGIHIALLFSTENEGKATVFLPRCALLFAWPQDAEVSVKIRAEIMIPAAFPPDGGKERNMRKKYEDACVEAGKKKEEIRKIRRVFESDREKLKYRKKQIIKYGILPFSYFETEEMDKQMYSIPDPHPTPEEVFVHRFELERLHDELAGLSSEDVELLIAFYDPEVVFTDYVRSVGGDRSRMLRRKDRLLKELREKLKDLI